MAKDLVGIDESGFEHRVFLDTDPSLTSDSDEKVASQKATRKYVDDHVIAPDGIKRYVALLTQSGTDAPVATVLENTLGGTVVWTRSGEGAYVGTLAGAFTINKTVISLAQPGGAGKGWSALLSGNTVGVLTATITIVGNVDDGYEVNVPNTDLMLSETLIEIRVYP